MKIKLTPVEWEIDSSSDFCCWEFKKSIIYDPYDPAKLSFHISKDGNKLLWNGKEISYCPFCGQKIEIEKILNE